MQTNYYLIELLMLDRNTWNSLAVCKLIKAQTIYSGLLLLVTKTHKIAYKLLVLNRHTWKYNCKQYDYIVILKHK